MLKVATAGSVDDGKSTLIGRLLHDSKSLMADELGTAADLARLTDGLRAEREQGITIDVAYRHFATPRRRFVLHDCPGHAQYTRNMATGASTADVALVLVDARRGMTEQSRRHLAIAALLGVPTVTVLVNKMDLVGYAEERFDAVAREVLDWAARLGLHGVGFIPVASASSRCPRSTATTSSTARRRCRGTAASRCSSTWRARPPSTASRMGRPASLSSTSSAPTASAGTRAAWPRGRCASATRSSSCPRARARA
jgi:small GTP-binding protein